MFAQTQQMLDIIEKMVEGAGYRYHRMDGTTPVAQRSKLMDDFNHNPDGEGRGRRVGGGGPPPIDRGRRSVPLAPADAG